jgi:hypothetical protein
MRSNTFSLASPENIVILPEADRGAEWCHQLASHEFTRVLGDTMISRVTSKKSPHKSFEHEVGLPQLTPLFVIIYIMRISRLSCWGLATLSKLKCRLDRLTGLAKLAELYGLAKPTA